MIFTKEGTTGMGDIVKNAPNALIVAVTICFVSVIAAFVVLAVKGADTTALVSFIGVVITALFSGGGLIASGAAAKSASNAEKATNGDLDKKVESAVRRAVYAPDNGNRPDNG